jgi:hypothetical protein
MERGLAVRPRALAGNRQGVARVAGADCKSALLFPFPARVAAKPPTQNPPSHGWEDGPGVSGPGFRAGGQDQGTRATLSLPLERIYRKGFAKQRYLDRGSPPTHRAMPSRSDLMSKPLSSRGNSRRPAPVRGELLLTFPGSAIRSFHLRG